MQTSRFGGGRWPALAVLLSLAACGDGTSILDGPGNDSCYPPTLGSPCTLPLTPYGVHDITFQAPGRGQSWVTISLTGSTTYAVWELYSQYAGNAACDNFTYGVDQSCVVLLEGGVAYRLIVYEAEGRAGETHLTIGQSQNLGSVARPVPVSTDSLVNGSVGASGSSYFSVRIPAPATYTVGLTGQFSQLSWEIFTDPGYANRVRECTFADQAPDLACATRLAARTYYLRVREFSGAPQDFQLAIGSGALNEGSAASPVPIDATPARVSTVDVFGHSYYAFTPVFSGPYAIQLDGHSITSGMFSYPFPGDYGWTLFGDPGLTTVVKECRDYRQIWPDGYEHCVAQLTAGVTYTLRVDEQAGYPNRMYTLTVVHRLAGGGSSEGTVDAPVPIPWPITSYSGWGDVAGLGSSYYSFQTGSSPGSLRIMVRPETDSFYFAGSNLTWFLFDDAGFSSEIARCDRAAGIAVQSCLTPRLAPSTTYYLRVDENDGIPQGFGLYLVAGFAPPTPSAPAAPVAIPLGAGGLDVVQDNTLSTGFYSFATSQAGTYRVTANLATGNVYGLLAWRLYDDPAFSHQVAHCFKSAGLVTSGTACTVFLPGGGSFYLKIQAVGAQSGVPGSTAIGGNDLHLAVERLGP